MIGIMIQLLFILLVLMAISNDLTRIAKAIERLSEEKKDEGSETDETDS